MGIHGAKNKGFKIAASPIATQEYPLPKRYQRLLSMLIRAYIVEKYGIKKRDCSEISHIG